MKNVQNVLYFHLETILGCLQALWASQNHFKNFQPAGIALEAQTLTASTSLLKDFSKMLETCLFIFQRAQQFGFLRKVKWFFVILDVFKAFEYGIVQKKYSKKHFSSILKKCLSKAVEAFKVWASKGITAGTKFSKCVLRAKRSQKRVKIVSEWKFELFWTFWKN